MVLHNPGNWHWVSKNLQSWARQWFETELTKIRAESGTREVAIRGVNDQEGDVDVSQRKGKVICLFDVKLVLDFAGEVDGNEVKGTITVPEVAHDTQADEFVFDTTIFSESKENSVIKSLIRQQIEPQLRKKLAEFGPVLMATHAKDIQHTAGNDPKMTSSGSSTRASTSTPRETTSTTTRATPRHISVTDFSDTVEFSTTAAELYSTFLDPARVAAWTRSKPEITPSQGGSYSLFGGNICGEFRELQPDKLIRETWRSKEWAAGHFATLSLKFEQGSSSTLLRTEWKGVPIEQEEVVKRNFQEYYITPIKTAFGFGAVL